MRPLLSLVLCCLLAACDQVVEIRPTPLALSPVDTPQQSLVYAADGSVIATLRLANRENVARGDLPRVLVDAVVAAEDRRFFAHGGLDLRAVVRAALANRRAGQVVQGGSTITQQLVKNRYLPGGAQTLRRKTAEARLALELERSASKDAILTDYLNTVYFGAGAYGVQAAARTYFGVDVADLSLTQAALLAGLIRSPESASPYSRPHAAQGERRRVLDAMVATAALERPAAEAAASASLGVQPPPPPPATRFPYFVEHVKRVLLADPRFGPDEAARVRLLFGGGLRVHTTIDPALQGQAEAAAGTFWSAPDDPEVALAVVRPSDGHLVAAVGGRDFRARQFDLATQGRRQPGSAFKTFALVAALQAGMRLDDVVDSGSVALPRGPGGPPWVVRSATRGPLSLRDALAVSSNGAFARLAVRLGPERVADQAHAMGVTSDLGHEEALVLGGLSEGVSPLEMAVAYATLANGGVHVPVTAITRVEDADGRPLWRPDLGPRVAMDPETAHLATQALRSVVEEGTGSAARLDRPAAGKTGTSQRHRDAWFVGFTPQLAAAVWIGYPDQERPLVGVHGVARVSGGTWPARIWKAFMQVALAGQPAADFPYPAHLARTVAVDPSTGGLATRWCPLTVQVTGLPKELPRFTCPHGPPPPAPSETAVVPSPSGPASP
ncbi:MAG TPA: transglycosylase domain-containing protein, partial [Egibacteraceae bacterium]|nr:transglycosylase domain-containing protein [Egibacteraceae bacterium]